MTVASYRKPLETYVCFRLDSKTYRMIRELAKSEKVSASEILRRACRDYLSRQHDRTGDVLLDPASFFQKLARIEKILTQLGIDLYAFVNLYVDYILNPRKFSNEAMFSEVFDSHVRRAAEIFEERTKE